MRDLLFKAIDEYIVFRRPIPFSKINLPQKVTTFRELVDKGFLSEWTDGDTNEVVCLPRMLAFEAVNEPRRRRFAYKVVGELLFGLRDNSRQGRPEVLYGEAIEPFTAVLAQDFPKYIREIKVGYYIVRMDERGHKHPVIVSNEDVLAGRYKDAEPTHLAFPTNEIDSFEDVGVAWDEELKRRGLGEYIKKRKSPVKDAKQASSKGTKGTPRVVKPSVFSFVRDPKLRSFIKRDFEDLRKARLWGSLRLRFVLAGGLVEGLLLDALMSNPAALRTAAANKEGKTPEHWGLGSLLDAAAELRLLRTTVEKLGSPVREFRNLVHPGVEWRSAHPIEIEEVEIAERVLDLVIRDLSRHAQTAAGTP